MRVGLFASSIVLLVGCKDGGEGGGDRIAKVIGTEGGVITSADGVLTIAIKPGALAEPTEIIVEEDDSPPDVYAPAYRVHPNVELGVAATLTYRHPLPPDPTGFAVGAIDPAEFGAGIGRWISLPVLRIDPGEQLVQGSDPQLSMFYALLDEGGGAVTETSAADDTPTGTSAGETGNDAATGSDTGASTSTSTTSGSGSAGEESTGADTAGLYPPECADVVPQPGYTVLLATGMPIFPGGGSVDIAMAGDGTFVGRDGNDLTRYDVPTLTGATFATGFYDASVGTKFRADGDLLLAIGVLGQILRVTPQGEISVWMEGLAFPNGLWPDVEGNVWVTERMGARVIRIAPDMTIDTIAEGTAATAANGVVFDPIRSQAFWTKYDAGEVWRAPIAAGGTPGQPVMVADLDGYSHGLALDVCGNVYVVDENMGLGSRVDRLFLDESAELLEVEQIADSNQLTVPVANVSFGFGTGAYDNWLYLVGAAGYIYIIDIGVPGEPVAPAG